MKKAKLILLPALVLLSALACNESPKYANRAEMIVDQIHNHLGAVSVLRAFIAGKGRKKDQCR